MKILGWLCIGFGLLIAIMPFFWVFSAIFIFLGAVFPIVGAINASGRRKVEVDVEYHPPKDSGVSNSMFGR